MLCWGMKCHGRLNYGQVGSGGGSEEKWGQYLDKTCGSTLSFCMIFFSKSYHVSCSLHISWQHEGSAKPLSTRASSVGAPVPNDRTQQVTRLILCSQQLWSSSEPVLESE